MIQRDFAFAFDLIENEHENIGKDRIQKHLHEDLAQHEI